METTRLERIQNGMMLIAIGVVIILCLLGYVIFSSGALAVADLKKEIATRDGQIRRTNDFIVTLKKELDQVQTIEQLKELLDQRFIVGKNPNASK
jgi:hypothetical protein